jgi:hypothetical protein
MKWWTIEMISLAAMFLGMYILEIIKSSGNFWLIPFILVAIGLIVAAGYSWQAKKEVKRG